jgi:mono/diheme cytochrome c family protein
MSRRWGLVSFALCAAIAASELAAADPGSQPDRSVQIENVYRGVTQDRSAHSPDEALFVEKCGMCHRQMGMGTVLLGRRVEPSKAMLEARSDLSTDLIVAAVRSGIGNMPRIARGEVSDAQLARITAYLAKAKPAAP